MGNETTPEVLPLIEGLGITAERGVNNECTAMA